MKKKSMKYLDLVMAALSVIALIMIFLPAVGSGDESHNGLKVVFGYKEETILGDAVIYKFSIMNLLTYLLVIGTAVCAALSFLKGNKTALFVAIALAIVSAIFFFLTKQFVVLNEDLAKAYEIANTTFAKEVDLGAGPIIGGICMIFAAGVGAAKLVLKK